MTCRCSCKAYGGQCDCRFDGVNAGRAEGERETIAAIVAWLRQPNAPTGFAIMNDLADDLEAGEWRK